MRKKLILIVAAVLIIGGCTDSKTTKHVLESQGYTNIQITGYRFFACGKDDFYHTGFTATTPSGQKIDGTVCSGMFFKGSTIRF